MRNTQLLPHHQLPKGLSINYVVSRGGGGQKLPIVLSKNTIKSGEGGQKLPILRRHSLWTAQKHFSKHLYQRKVKDGC